MTDDDLRLLVDFRSEVPTPDAEATRRAHRAATSVHTHARHVSAMALLRRRRSVAAVAVATLVVVPTALAFSGKIGALFNGIPAPPSISSNFKVFNRMADLATQKGFAAKLPQADVSKAHGVIEIATADGPEDLWAAPDDQGGLCWFMDFANDSPGPNGQPGFGGCDPSTPPDSKINWGDVWTVLHPALRTVFGHVYVAAASLQLTLADGSTASFPVVEGMFFGSLDKGAKVTRLAAYDGSGREVAATLAEVGTARGLPPAAGGHPFSKGG